MSVRKRRTQIAGQFAAHRIDMLRSPAWRVLSLSARRVLDRLEIEHADHGGAENGRLPVTYEDFHQYGIHRHAIGPAIREVVALGFAEITEAQGWQCRVSQAQRLPLDLPQHQPRPDGRVAKDHRK